MQTETLTFRTSEVPIDIRAAEQKYNATFVGDFCIKNRRGDFLTETVAVFWQPIPPVEGYSHYFALLVRGDVVFITSGQTAFDLPIYGIRAKDGEIVYSRHRHDYRSCKDGSGSIDGGRDYTKLSASELDNTFPELVELKIVNQIIQVHPCISETLAY